MYFQFNNVVSVIRRIEMYYDLLSNKEDAWEDEEEEEDCDADDISEYENTNPVLTKEQRVFLFVVFVSTVLLVAPFWSQSSQLKLPKYVSPMEWHQENPNECILPKLDPFHPSIKNFIGPPNSYNCSKKYSPIFYSDLDSNIVVNASQENTKYFNCCWKEIIRGGAYFDNSISFSKKCEPMKDNITVISKEINAVAVYCENKDANNKSEMVDTFGLVKLKHVVENRIKNWTSMKKQKQSESVNVVILGIDSVSHMEFHRSMTKSQAFLKQNLSALSMEGYTKIGDGTFENIIGVLGGMTDAEARKSCSSNSFYDRCPLIWKDFFSAGYRTMFIEDGTAGGVFNWADSGFIWAPVSYYYRPLMMVAHDYLKNNPIYNWFYSLCYGPRLAFQIILDIMKKAAHTFGKDKRYFKLAWVSSMTHDMLNNGKIGDAFLLEYLQWMQSRNYFNNTVLIIMSDHGMRFGSIRNTFQGSVEERMPFVYTIFPKWFKKKYSKAIRNYRENSKLLTNPFDLHETLTDLVNLRTLENKNILNRTKNLIRQISNPQLGNISVWKKQIRGISWFLPLPSRNCKQSQIPGHYCICHQMKNVSLVNNKNVASMANSVIEQINQMVTKVSRCAALKLKSIFGAHEVISSNRAVRSQSVTYQLFFSTSPGDGSFEATAVRDSPKGKWVLSGRISRTNTYGNQSHCVREREMKKFCYCK